MIVEIRREGSDLHVRWRSQADLDYVVEQSSDLVNWTTLGDRLPGTGDLTSAVVAIPDPAATRRFIRIRQVE